MGVRDRTVDRGAESAADPPSVAPGRSVLVLAPRDATGVERALLPPTGGRLLAVGVASDPARTVARHRDRPDVEPGPCALVRVGPSAGEGAPERATVERVDDPANLTAVGTALTRVVGEWGPGWRAWVDSLGPLVHHVGVADVYRFADVFAGRVAADDATAFARLDPALHDDRTVQRLLGAFDTAVWDDRDGSGGWRVRRRE
jgi:hypothetical protein